MIPSERIETPFASTVFEKKSFKELDEKACRGKENIDKRVEQRKNFEAEKELGDREIQSQFEKEEEEKQRRETLMQVDTRARNREDYRRRIGKFFVKIREKTYA